MPPQVPVQSEGEVAGKVRLSLVLAQGPGALAGALDDRLELCLWITPQGRIDPAAYDSTDGWTSRRVLPDGRERSGEIVPLDDGWALRSIGGDDAPLFPIEATVLRPGEFVVLRQPDGQTCLFRIVGLDRG
jgi:hypothetical protein